MSTAGPLTEPLRLLSYIYPCNRLRTLLFCDMIQSREFGVVRSLLIQEVVMKVQFTETVLRDANQSLIATRLPFDKFEKILPVMDKAGYYSVEC